MFQVLNIFVSFNIISVREQGREKTDQTKNFLQMILNSLKISGCRCTFSVCHSSSIHHYCICHSSMCSGVNYLIVTCVVRVGFVNMMWS